MDKTKIIFILAAEIDGSGDFSMGKKILKNCLDLGIKPKNINTFIILDKNFFGPFIDLYKHFLENCVDNRVKTYVSQPISKTKLPLNQKGKRQLEEILQKICTIYKNMYNYYDNDFCKRTTTEQSTVKNLRRKFDKTDLNDKIITENKTFKQRLLDIMEMVRGDQYCSIDKNIMKAFIDNFISNRYFSVFIINSLSNFLLSREFEDITFRFVSRITIETLTLSDFNLIDSIDSLVINFRLKKYSIPSLKDVKIINIDEGGFDDSEYNMRIKAFYSVTELGQSFGDINSTTELGQFLLSFFNKFLTRKELIHIWEKQIQFISEEYDDDEGTNQAIYIHENIDKLIEESLKKKYLIQDDVKIIYTEPSRIPSLEARPLFDTRRSTRSSLEAPSFDIEDDEVEEYDEVKNDDDVRPSLPYYYPGYNAHSNLVLGINIVPDFPELSIETILENYTSISTKGKYYICYFGGVGEYSVSYNLLMLFKLNYFAKKIISLNDEKEAIIYIPKACFSFLHDDKFLSIINRIFPDSQILPKEFVIKIETKSVFIRYFEKVLYNEFLNLIKKSENLCMLSGDQSYFEGISMGKNVIYDLLQHKIHLYRQILKMYNDYTGKTIDEETIDDVVKKTQIYGGTYYDFNNDIIQDQITVCVKNSPHEIWVNIPYYDSIDHIDEIGVSESRMVILRKHGEWVITMKALETMYDLNYNLGERMKQDGFEEKFQKDLRERWNLENNLKELIKDNIYVNNASYKKKYVKIQYSSVGGKIGFKEETTRPLKYRINDTFNHVKGLPDEYWKASPFFTHAQKLIVELVLHYLTREAFFTLKYIIGHNIIKDINTGKIIGRGANGMALMFDDNIVIKIAKNHIRSADEKISNNYDGIVDNEVKNMTAIYFKNDYYDFRDNNLIKLLGVIYIDTDLTLRSFFSDRVYCSSQLPELVSSVRIEDKIGFVIMEKYDGELNQVETTKITLEMQFDILYQMFDQLDYLFKKGYYHTDIHASNWFYRRNEEKYIIRIGDYGSDNDGYGVYPLPSYKNIALNKAKGIRHSSSSIDVQVNACKMLSILSLLGATVEKQLLFDDDIEYNDYFSRDLSKLEYDVSEGYFNELKIKIKDKIDKKYTRISKENRDKLKKLIDTL